MGQLQLVLDFVGKVAWPIVAVGIVLMLREPAVALLRALTTRIGQDLESASLAGLSVKFRPGLDAKMREAAKESVDEAAGVPIPREQLAALIQKVYLRAIGHSFLEWYRLEGLTREEEEGGEQRQALLRWVRAFGVTLISDYELFLEFCNELQGLGFKIVPPPTRKEFESAVEQSLRTRAQVSALRRAASARARWRREGSGEDKPPFGF